MPYMSEGQSLSLCINLFSSIDNAEYLSLQEIELSPFSGVRGARKLTVCPCCGSRFEGDLQKDGCALCGALAVGPPLPQPEHELPFYGRALLVATLGALPLLTFFIYTLVALIKQSFFSFNVWSLTYAAEAASWQMKALVLPFAIIASLTGARICRSIRREPSRFAGMKLAHGGLASSILVAVMIVAFIGVTIPERLRQHQNGVEAATLAPLYTFRRAVVEYRILHDGGVPGSFDDIKHGVPDPDHSIETALSTFDPLAYKAWSVQARAEETKGPKLRGAALRHANARLDDSPSQPLAFTNYELRLPGEDGVVGTADDPRIVDGVIMSAAQARQHSSTQDESSTP